MGPQANHLNISMIAFDKSVCTQPVRSLIVFYCSHSRLFQNNSPALQRQAYKPPISASARSGEKIDTQKLMGSSTSPAPGLAALQLLSMPFIEYAAMHRCLTPI